MIVCKTCGFTNEEGATFCGSCGSFLEWTGEERLTPTPPTPTPPDTGQGQAAGPEAPPPEDWSGRTFPSPQLPDQDQVERPETWRELPQTIVEGVVCEVCGTVNEADRNFCQRCASPLTPGGSRARRRQRDDDGGGPPAILVIGGVAVVILVVGALALFGLGFIGGGSGADASPTPTTGPATSASPTATATLTPTLEPGVSAPPQVGPGELVAGWPAATVSDRLRVRSTPEVTDASVRYNPLLALGTKVLVMAGPTEGSGYQWYRIVPYASDGTLTGPYGWSAAGSKEGEAWIETRPVECPPPSAADAGTLAGLGPAGWTCFGSTELTFNARVIPCDCDAIAVGEPAWLTAPKGIGLVVPEGEGAPFPAWIDPAAFPDGVPEADPDAVVRVTGHFADTAAASCTFDTFNGSPESMADVCTLRFVVTGIEAASR